MGLACWFRLNSKFRSNVWATFLDSWNDASMMAEQTQQEVRVHILTDASGSYDCRAWDPASGEWIELEWEQWVGGKIEWRK